MSSFVIKPAVRTENITYAIRDIIVVANEVAKTGKEMLYLNIGDPPLYDFVPPKHLIEATYDAMKQNHNGYGPSTGTKGALEAIEKDAELKGIKNINEIFVSHGAGEAIEICLTALVNDGENVLNPSPGYPLYSAIESKLRSISNPYYLDESNGWQPNIEDMKSKVNDKTRAIILVNPHNPTGSIISAETLRQIIDIAKKHNLVILADEIYDKLIMDGKHLTSCASLNHDVPMITFGGLSKNYMVPGFRIGWGIVSGDKTVLKDYVEAINKMLRARLSANHPEQYGIAPALLGDQSHLEIARQKLTSRRNLTVEMMNSIQGISCVPPLGAFYAFPRLHNVTDDLKFVIELLKETGVVVVHGGGFGQMQGTSHFRIVFLPPENILEKAYKAISKFHEKYIDKFEKAAL